MRLDPGQYLVGPGDVLKMKSMNKEFSDMELRVAPDGNIYLDGSGVIPVAHKTIAAIEKDINDTLKRLYSNIEIRLLLITSVNSKVIVLGDVKSPGVLNLDSDMTVIEAIAKAGGFSVLPNEPSNIDRISMLCRITRENSKGILIDIKKIMFQNGYIFNVPLKNNDIVYVYKHF
jgi:polysaccharide export outer membrane protein